MAQKLFVIILWDSQLWLTLSLSFPIPNFVSIGRIFHHSWRNFYSEACPTMSLARRGVLSTKGPVGSLTVQRSAACTRWHGQSDLSYWNIAKRDSASIFVDSLSACTNLCCFCLMYVILDKSMTLYIFTAIHGLGHVTWCWHFANLHQLDCVFFSKEITT